MAEQISVITVGNSAIKMALVKKGQLTQAGAWYYQAEPQRVFKKVLAWHQKKKVTKACYISVNPSVTQELIPILTQGGIFIRPLKRAWPRSLTSLYDTRRIGMDRLCNVVAARRLHRAPNLLIIDSGTALTLEVIEKNQHLGGFIGVGEQMAWGALHQKTGLLPRLKKAKRVERIPTTTEEALSLTVQLQFEGGLRHLVDFVRRTRKKEYQLIRTGNGIQPMHDEPSVSEPWLTLEGMVALFQEQQ